MDLKYIDVHSHVAFGDFDSDRAEVLVRMEEGGVGTISVGVDYASSVAAIEFSEGKEHFYATIGVHPNLADSESFDASKFSELVKNPKVVGVGECGLDYFRTPDGKEKQKEQFLLQQQFALNHNLPLMIHCRPTKGTMDAYEDLLALLDPTSRGNIHFFVGNLAIAQQFWSRGFTTSYTGVLTFTTDYDEVVRAAPLDMFLVETDSPYAAPAPHRGARNEPTYVAHVVAAIARIRGEDEGVVGTQILTNTRRVFSIS